MENKNVLNNEDLAQVSGGGVDPDIVYIHSNCGGHITTEDCGTYHPDIWMTCPKCGKTWHPHNDSKVGHFEDMYTVVTGSF